MPKPPIEPDATSSSAAAVTKNVPGVNDAKDTSPEKKVEAAETPKPPPKNIEYWGRKLGLWVTKTGGLRNEHGTYGYDGPSVELSGAIVMGGFGTKHPETGEWTFSEKELTEDDVMKAIEAFCGVKIHPQNHGAHTFHTDDKAKKGRNKGRRRTPAAILHAKKHAEAHAKAEAAVKAEKKDG